MKDKNVIKFAANAGDHQLPAPWDRGNPTFEDQIFKHQLCNRLLQLETGPNWIRIVPALLDSDHWLKHVPAITMQHGRFAHPSAFENGGKCAFDHAYQWFASNAPEKLYNRKNRRGHRLLCDSLCAFWCLTENRSGKVEAKLLISSAYDGLKGGMPGLGFRIWQKVAKADPEVDVILNPIHPKHGAMVCIERDRAPGSRYDTYQIRVGRRESPIQEFLDRMEGIEFDALCPIEQTIRELSEDEQWEHLARVIGADVAADIRSSLV